MDVELCDMDKVNNKMKCLLIHGFGGGTYEVKPLAEYLVTIGYEVSFPTLKGHSATLKDFKRSTYKEWIGTAEQELLRLMETGGDIALIGFSMGGLIAFDLACKYQISNIVSINTPIFYWNISQIFFNIINDIKSKDYKYIKKYLQAKNDSPLLSIIQFLLLLHRTKPKLVGVKCPILIIQSEDDDTVRRKSVDYINKHVSSADKNIRYFPEGGHFILESPAASMVRSCVEEFLQD